MASDNLALLVNPKTTEFCYSEIDGSEVRVRTLDSYPAGEGYFDSSASGSGWTYDVTGLPRVHTPNGVRDKGGGYGTVLYTALCHAAHRSLEETTPEHGPPSATEGDGISSGEPRSKFADTWWDRAKDRYGLAHEEQGRIEDSFEVHLDGGNNVSIQQVIRDYLRAEKVKVDGYRMEAMGTAMVLKTADAYPYSAATDANLVLADLPLNDESFDEADPRRFSRVNVEAIIAGGFGLLGERARRRRAGDPKDLDASLSANVLFEVLRHAGASKADIERCRLRFLTGVDDDPRTWQEIGDYSGMVSLRENPSPRPKLIAVCGRKRLSLVRCSQTPRAWSRPRATPAARAVAYRRNPSTQAFARPAAVREAVERVHVLRARLGWGVFMADRQAP